MEPPALGLADPGPARFAERPPGETGCGRPPTAAAADKPAQAEPLACIPTRMLSVPYMGRGCCPAASAAPKVAVPSTSMTWCSSMHVPVETTATSASSRTSWLLFLVLFLAPVAVDAQWSVRRSADGTVSASAVSPDRSMGVLITCTGRSMEMASRKGTPVAT